jgi:hypothetical protein
MSRLTARKSYDWTFTTSGKSRLHLPTINVPVRGIMGELRFTCPTYTHEAQAEQARPSVLTNGLRN